jgi:hypothetical protein
LFKEETRRASCSRIKEALFCCGKKRTYSKAMLDELQGSEALPAQQTASIHGSILRAMPVEDSHQRGSIAFEHGRQSILSNRDRGFTSIEPGVHAPETKRFKADASSHSYNNGFVHNTLRNSLISQKERSVLYEPDKLAVEDPLVIDEIISAKEKEIIRLKELKRLSIQKGSQYSRHSGSQYLRNPTAK